MVENGVEFVIANISRIAVISVISVKADISVIANI
jgi:hypothetical protein